MWTLRGLSVDPAKAQAEKSAKCAEPTSWMVSGTHHHIRTNFCFSTSTVRLSKSSRNPMEFFFFFSTTISER